MLTISDQHLQEIQAHAEQAYPQECCGLLLGHSSPDPEQPEHSHNQVRHLHAAANTWDVDKHEFAPAEQDTPATRRYWISAQELLTTQQHARRLGCDIIGVYHSHPDHPAIPSECDRKWAWPQYSYIIVAVHGGSAQDVQSWMLDTQQAFVAEPIMISPSTHP